jgi:hypothetical protein
LSKAIAANKQIAEKNDCVILKLFCNFLLEPLTFGTWAFFPSSSYSTNLQIKHMLYICSFSITLRLYLKSSYSFREKYTNMQYCGYTDLVLYVHLLEILKVYRYHSKFLNKNKILMVSFNVSFRTWNT